jgi:DNA repair protein RadD
LNLRPYQEEAVSLINSHLAGKHGNPLVVMPTGAGKTLVFSHLIRSWLHDYPAIRVIVLADRVELVVQATEKLRKVWPQAPVGIYAASLNSRDTAYPVTVAQIQSIYGKGYDVDPFDVAIVDEAHTIPFDGEGRYRTFLTACRKCNPNLRVVGFTATPYRLDGGHIARRDGILNHVCYEADVEQMIADGYLCPLRSAGAREAEISAAGVRTRQGDFVASELEKAAMADGKVDAAVRELVRRGADRQAWLLFCSGVAHAHAVASALAGHGVTAPVVTGETPADVRKRILGDFDAGRVQCVVNVNCLTTGLDVTRIDLIGLLRPTQSTSLYVQMVGRGFRLHPGKADCLVLDFGGNVRRHGPINRIRVGNGNRGDGGGEAPVRQCPECDEFLPIATPECPECGYVFPRDTGPKHDERPDTATPIIAKSEPVVFEVDEVTVSVHEKQGSVPSLRVTYYGKGPGQRVSEWVCFGHVGFPRSKAEAWWRSRFPGERCPATAAEAAGDMFLAHKLTDLSESVKVVPEGKYLRVGVVTLRKRERFGVGVLDGQGRPWRTTNYSKRPSVTPVAVSPCSRARDEVRRR